MRKLSPENRIVKILLLILLPWILTAQQDDETAIRLLQDQRSKQFENFAKTLEAPDARIRELSLLALANIQDTSSLEIILPRLNDESDKVRSMAAFAVGVLGNPRGANPLFRRLSVERNAAVVGELLNAIGLCGTKEDLRKLVIQSDHYRKEWNPHVAQAVYRFANRKIKDISAAKLVVTLLDDQKSILNAAYALMRMNDTSIIKMNLTRVRRLLSNASPVIRMWGATMLGTQRDAGTINALIVRAKRDKDWRVRVNAIRSLRSKPAGKKTLLELAADKNEHVALEAIQSHESIASTDTKWTDSATVMAFIGGQRYHPSVQDEAKKIIAKRMGERALPYIAAWSSASPFVSARRIKALGETRSAKAVPIIKEALQQSPHSLVTIACLEAYQQIAQRLELQEQKEFLKTAVLQFGKNDAGISYTAAIAFQDTSFHREIRKIFQTALVSEYLSLNAAEDLEPMVELLNLFAEFADSSSLPAVAAGLRENDDVIRKAAARAYKSITGESPEITDGLQQKVQPISTLQDLKLLDQYSGARIQTSKGMITVTFQKEAAPFTVVNFIQLAQKKFYDGLSFHRVVSNFVIQGGDPLGNGSGGPKYAIRTEIHPSVKYSTGAVGMASAGKDTEGSQWFITHCPTPHLDYRYTIFGTTKDLAVVNSIMVGDIIRTVELF